uniref:B30.2/SPRY domain-containing protein n=1 Tax=Paramormyrops kingsleyae TaxID=1676925 RepID=A0A3B3S6T5_9TELE
RAHFSDTQLRCCICLDVFTSPVSTPCGHNFCQACLQGYWDRCDFYRCPLCKAIFDEKPKLSINYSFSEITELFKDIQAFTTLVGSIVRSQIEFVEKVQEKQKAEETRAEGFINELEKEITELQRRNIELEQLWYTEDLIHFLQRLPMLYTSPCAQDWTEANVHADVGVGTVRCVTSGLKRAFRETENFSSTAVDVTLDPSTANPWLILSVDGKQVWDGDTQLHLPDYPKRFDSSVCVLAKESFTTGRHYWEVEVGEKIAWDIGVVRESINRKGIISANPEDGYWTMCLRHSNMYSCCGTCCFSLPLNRRPRKLGVYLDYEEGQISFYNVDAQSHMYTHHHTFTERLYPFFSPYTNDDGPNTAPLVIPPVRTAAQ